MAEEVERLVVAPFREIVEKANQAIVNAGDADEHVSAPMLKAAQNLAKEGERALKKIEPLCKKNNDDYGSNFVDAIKEHDGIGQFRSELEDLLWDFDDYIEPDEFDGDKFSELQKASRHAAPKIVDILKRMKLVAPAPTLAPLQPSRAVSPSPMDMSRDGASIIIDAPPSSSEKTMDEVELQLSNMMGAQAGPDQGLKGASNARPVDRSNSNRSRISDRASEPPPRPPSTNPWEVGNPPPGSPDRQLDEGDPTERRLPVTPGDSPTLPLIQPRMSQGSELKQQQQQQHSPSLSQSVSYNSAGSMQWQNNRLRTGSTPPPLNGSGQSSNPSSSGSMRLSRPPSNGSSVFANGPPSIPEHSAVDNHTHTNASAGNPSFYPQVGESFGHNHPQRQPSTDSFNSSIFDCVPYDGATSPVPSTQRTSSVISTTPGSPYSPGNRISQPPQYSANPPVYQNQSISTNYPDTIVNQSSSTLTPQPQGQSRADSTPAVPEARRMDDPGIIPVESEAIPPMPSRAPDCSIGPYSSFYQLKGFCKGAEEAVKGELGFKRIKRPVGGFSMMVVAKCNHCLFELDYRSVEQDLNNDSSGNFTSHGIGFRLRILQKSHLPIKNIDEQLYGCVFCIQTGQTIEESDSTVFFNQKQLFAHMARHPRPLPAVPGLTIVEGADMHSHSRDNFDLYFPNPPVQTVMQGIAREIGKLPTAVATETRKNANGILRSPPDRGTALQFAVGARIVGIEFPLRYDGKWGIGWHDGVRAAFEADSVRLDPPPRNEVRMQGTSNMQALARWKWNQSGEGNWLKFNKGETIKNISWSYTDHWCWSGTSSKGWGIFPQSHIEPKSLKTVNHSDDTSVNSAEGKSVLSRFSIRKNADRKFGSVSSGDSGPNIHIY
ncbi:uncharacterized protein BCR38DRAFT_484903 [Pseudomassariella vexata]|uniref:SH3 domain-containing protein n=1 Tax=Pseudomassariella vexata TaxID=1141098 RepID=A0A1Y2E2E3_9PEZI|nr:uncharacterized protein BCR38DRAFT_484903 [Pseudomassariella vexata]ORY65486.1 hypothetical protein BCR38DRAFT_484903 [Pseudomassariella vexata]